jgi:hypothetical protein
MVWLAQLIRIPKLNYLERSPKNVIPMILEKANLRPEQERDRWIGQF